MVNDITVQMLEMTRRAIKIPFQFLGSSELSAKSFKKNQVELVSFCYNHFETLIINHDNTLNSSK